MNAKHTEQKCIRLIVNDFDFTPYPIEVFLVEGVVRVRVKVRLRLRLRDDRLLLLLLLFLGADRRAAAADALLRQRRRHERVVVQHRQHLLLDQLFSLANKIKHSYHFRSTTKATNQPNSRDDKATAFSVYMYSAV